MEQQDQEYRDALIAKYLSGELSQDEISVLKKWISASKENLTYFRQIKNIWDNTDHSIDKKMIDSEKAFLAIKSRVTFRTPAANFWFYWKKFAAVLLIPLVLGNLLYFLFYDSNYTKNQEPVYNELFAAFGTRSALKLSDGTSVWLNSGSSIKYPDRFVGNKRIVELKGEAYFEVQHDPTRPFIVKTSSISVKATGTKFNVSGYDLAEDAEVTLVSGKVEVNPTDNNKNIISTKLNPDQHYSVNKVSGKSSVTTEDTYKFISWKDGKLIFRNEPLSEVIKKISQVFNVDIELQGTLLQDYRYRATFQDESLAEILKLLKISSPIDYTEIKRNPLPDGSFPRKKVLIYSAKNK
jgi:ferric-dicitrate binding protein FerR (iron transport regulator)